MGGGEASGNKTLTLTLRARRVQDGLLALNLCSRKRERNSGRGN